MEGLVMAAQLILGLAILVTLERMIMKLNILLIATVILFVSLISVAQQAPPLFPFTVNGTITVDGVKLTQTTAGSNYKIAIRKPDGSA